MANTTKSTKARKVTTSRKAKVTRIGRFRRDWKLFPALIVAFAVLGIGTYIISTHAITEGELAWNVRCAPSGYAADDPIVYPGQPGVSHMHMFFSNKSTNAYSTTASLLANQGNCINTFGEVDRSAYWVPALYKKNADGTSTLMGGSDYHISAYYRRAGGVTATKVKPFPMGLRMIAGNANSTTPQSHAIAYWQCGAGGPEYDNIPKCTQNDPIRGDIMFPSCWNGVNLDSADHRSHMAYPDGNGNCPADHPVKLPQLNFEIWFDGIADNTGLYLASDKGGPGLSLHGDFWNAWNNQVQNALVDGCINYPRICIGLQRNGNTLFTAAGSPYPLVNINVLNYPAASPWNIPEPGTSTPPPMTPPPAPTDTTAPSVPSSLRVTSSTSTSVALSWSASTDNVGVTGYRIYRGGSQIGTSTGASFTNTGLSPSTSYSYTVAAVDAAGNVSAQSTAVSATTTALSDTVAPSVPTGLTLSARSATSLTLIWNPSTDNVGVTGYKVYHDGVLVGNVTSTTFTEKNLQASSTHDYTVAAYDAAGNTSGQSAPLTATTSAASTCKRTWWGKRRCTTQVLTTTTSMPSSSMTAATAADPSMAGMNMGGTDYQEPKVASTNEATLFGTPVSTYKSTGFVALVVSVGILLVGWIFFVQGFGGRSNLKIWK